MFYTYYSSSVGKLLLVGDGEALCMIGFPSGRGRIQVRPEWQESPSMFHEAAGQLGAYFRGELQQFSLNLNPSGTPFQKQVYSELQKIPYGETTTYGAIARQIGRPKASRAVGAANGSNPISIVIPCHRVVGSDGSLTGFGGGLETKRYLIDLEKSQRTLF